MEGFLLSCSLFVLLLLQQKIGTNSGIGSQKVPLKSVHQMENKFKKKNLRLLKNTKIELKPFWAGPASW